MFAVYSIFSSIVPFFLDSVAKSLFRVVGLWHVIIYDCVCSFRSSYLQSEYRDGSDRNCCFRWVALGLQSSSCETFQVLEQKIKKGQKDFFIVHCFLTIERCQVLRYYNFL